MSIEPLAEASRLLDLIRSLPKEEKVVAEYFLKYVSVGDLRAVLDLKRLGVKDPQPIIERLVEYGILERGVDCYNLSKPLRDYVLRRRR
jgi:hypothetical protein